MTSITVDKGLAWAVPIGGFISNFIVGGLAKSYGIILVSTKELFDCSAAPLTLAGGFIYMFMYCLSLVGIFLSQKYGCRLVINIGAVGSLISFIIAFFATNVTTWVIAIGGLLGISLAFIYSPLFVMVGRCFRKRVGVAMGISVAGVSIGQIAFPSIISVVIDTYGARGAYLIGGGIACHFFISAALMPRYIVDGYSDKNEVVDDVAKPLVEKSDDVHLEEIKHNGENGKHLKEPDDAVISDPKYAETGLLNKFEQKDKNLDQEDKSAKKKKSDKFQFENLHLVMLVLFIIAKIFGDIGDVGVAFALPPFGESSLGLEKPDISLAIAAAGAIDLISRIFIGILSDQPWCRRSLILAAAWFLEGLNSFFFLWFQNRTAYYIFYGIFGLCSGTAITLMTVVLTDLVGQKNLPVSFATMMFVLGIFIAPGQFLVGYLADVTGTYDWSMIFLGLNLFFAFIFMCLEYPIKRFFFNTTKATVDPPIVKCKKVPIEGTTMDDHEVKIIDMIKDPRSRLSSISTLSRAELHDILPS